MPRVPETILDSFCERLAESQAVDPRTISELRALFQSAQKIKADDIVASLRIGSPATARRRSSGPSTILSDASQRSSRTALLTRTSAQSLRVSSPQSSAAQQALYSARMRRLNSRLMHHRPSFAGKVASLFLLENLRSAHAPTVSAALSHAGPHVRLVSQGTPITW
jgi:hypothetical protein